MDRDTKRERGHGAFYGGHGEGSVSVRQQLIETDMGKLTGVYRKVLDACASFHNHLKFC